MEDTHYAIKFLLPVGAICGRVNHWIGSVDALGPDSTQTRPRLTGYNPLIPLGSLTT